MSRKPQKCPTCKSRVLEIVYGMPEMPAEDDGHQEVIYAGCVIPPYAPTWQCERCGQSGGRFGGAEDELPLNVALRNAVGGAVHKGPPRTWAEVGLRRTMVQRRGLFDLQELLTWERPWFVRSYVTESSGWAFIEDEPEDRFGIGVAVLREGEADVHHLGVGDTVLYLGEVEGESEPVLWPPAVAVRMSSGGRRRTVWTLDDKLHRASGGGEYILLRALDPEDRSLVEDLVMTGRATTRDELLRLYQLFWLRDP